MIQRSVLLVGLLSISVAALSCGSSSTGGSPVCSELTGYTSSTQTQYSFATDILPILQDQGLGNPAGSSCASATICHGTPPIALNNAGAPQTLSFVGAAATVKAALLANSVNAPSTKRVVPSNVGQSLLAYKISGQDALSCGGLSCVSGASVGTKKPCGDAMPTVGTLSASDRTKILDWIAQGAKD
jgi:hypothetical protein